MNGYTRGYSLPRLGALVVLAGSMFLMAFGFMTGRALDGTSTMVFVRVPTAEGLKVGDAVLLRGVQVGEVKSIDFSENVVVVRAKLTKHVPLTRGASAALVASDMFGRQSLVLKARNPSAPALASGDTLIGTSASSMTESIDGIGKSAQRMLNDTTTELLREVMVGLSQAAMEIADLAAEARGEVKARSAQMGAVADNVAALTSPTAMAQMQGSLNSSATSAAHALAQLDSTTAAMREIVAGLNAGKGSAGRLLNDDSLYVRVNGTLASLEALLTDIRANPKRYINVSVF